MSWRKSSRSTNTGTCVEIASPTRRFEDDVTAMLTTMVEIRDDVKWLKRAVHALLTHHGLTVE
jgi:uncharacterized protein DUF397